MLSRLIAALVLALLCLTPAAAENFKVEVVPPIGHGSGVKSMAISPDGRFFATAGGSEQTAKLWDYTTGKVLRTFVGHTDAVVTVAFSPDSKWLFTGSEDKTLRRWDIATGETMSIYGGYTDSISAIAFSLDGREVVAGDDDGRVKLWDILSGQLVDGFFRKGQYNYQHVRALTFAPDGRKVIALQSDALRTWDIASGNIETVTFGFDTGNDYPSVYAISPDGRKAVGVRRDNKWIRFYDVADNSLNVTLDVHWIRAAAFSADGRLVFTGNEDGSVSVFDRNQASLIQSFGSGPAVHGLAVTADGRQVVALGLDDTMTVFDVATGEKLRVIEAAAESIGSAVFTSDGARAFTSGKIVRLRDLASGAILRSFDGSAGELSISADGGRLLTGNGSDNGKAVRAYDVASGKLLGSFDARNRVQALALSPDGSLAAAASFDDNNMIDVWSVDSGKRIRAINTRSIAPVREIRFNAGGVGIFANEEPHEDDIVRLWDAKSGKSVRVYKTNGEIIATGLSADGTRLLTGDWDGHMRLWDVASGKRLANFDVGDGDYFVSYVGFSPDGRYAVSGGYDNVIRVWDIESGGVVTTLTGHAGHIRAVRFDDDGTHISSIAADGTLRRWDRATGQLQVTTVFFTNGEWVRITPEGFFESSAHGAEQLTVVRGLDFYSIDQVYQALYRPDLVAAKLAGDPEGKVRDAAAKLDLDKVIGSGGAPKVAITSPSAGAGVDADTVEVEASVTDQGGGIGRIEWRVNGVTLGIDGRGFDRLTANAPAASLAPGKTISVKQKLSLDPGENIIEVVAYNEKGLIASDPASLTVKWEGATASTPPKLYVLAIGVNDYWDSRLKLTYAASDATAIGEAFKKSGEKLYSDVDVTTVLDADATAANLDKVFAGLSARVHPRDVFVFFLAGHGKTEDGRYYFLPQDFRYEDESSIAKGGIDQEKFQAWFATIAARKSVLLYDTCDSGSLTKSGIAARGLEQVAALARMTRAMGRTVLSASTDDAPALEGYRNHGVFTYALLEALGSGDANHDGTIEVTELAGAIDKSVPDISYAAFKFRQVPQMSIVGSDFPLAEQTAVLADAPADAATPAFPATPTHVVIAAAPVREAADENAAVVAELTPGGQVRLLETKDGWSLVARDGARLGYIRDAALAAMH